VVLTALAAVLAMVALGVLGADGDHHHGWFVLLQPS
jgi:deoxyxylulose-5-phosphate synthase